ncbi:MAG: SUMF1/EgtB/PvdO family nonheme iron enzyme [Myxococcales bacterium]|nr:SUMF1/EgtB/PvdO family nonheme iron enzyme [Myxococcales bacterium]
MHRLIGPRSRRYRAAAAGAAALVAGAACRDEGDAGAAHAFTGPSHAVTASVGAPAAAVGASVRYAPSAGPSAPAAALGSSAAPDGSIAPGGACPGGMVLVAGAYCPEVEQKCVAHTKDYEQQERRRAQAKAEGRTFDERPAPERCVRFAEPSRCLSRERRPVRFCMDRYEWPNRQGELPALLRTWTEAHRACADVHKRLCTADEFNFACEGEDLRPYSYGYARDDTRCNVDKPYVQPNQSILVPYDLCQEHARCRTHLAELDQREPAGSRPGCVSPFGVFDLNGNVNEWVERPGETAPRRSGLKGGWWGPARSRCRPMVTAHDENYAGYEVGFRCCADAGGRSDEGTR